MKKRITGLSDRRKFVRACLWTLMIVSCISVGRALLSYDFDGSYSHSIYLSVLLESPQDGNATLYYDIGKGFNENHSVSVFVNGDGQIHKYLFEIPNKTIFQSEMGSAAFNPWLHLHPENRNPGRLPKAGKVSKI